MVTGGLRRAICFYYDGLNRLKGKTYQAGIADPASYACPADTGLSTITYTYDATAGQNNGLGRRTGMTDASGSASWVFASRGRIILNPEHKHAVTHLGGTAPANQNYWYDANGNAVWRIGGGLDVTLTYNRENQLTDVTGGVTESYLYDGDGKRVKGTGSGTTTTYIGDYYELQGATVKKYYNTSAGGYAGNVRVAQNNGGTLYFLLGDHLSSTNLTVTSSGARVTQLRYYASPALYRL